MANWIIFACGITMLVVIVLLAYNLHIIRKNKEVVGVLKVIHVEGEAPSIFLELHKSPEFLENTKEVTLKVSQEKPSL